MNEHILIVEDSLTQAAELRNLLQKHGYQVTVAANGKEGLAAARERKPDLVISDVLMPVMDGYEMCHVIKRDEALEDIPVILLTVLSDTEDVIQALKAGVDYYLTKPYYEDHLLSRVESALAKPVQRKSKGAEERLEVTFGGERYVITSGRQQILNLLLSTYDSAVRQNRELIETQRELQKLNEQLEEKIGELEEMQDRLIRTERLATIGQLGASVGHELRHPLSVISNSVYYLNMKLEDADEKLKKHLGIMEREIAITNKIIGDLLSFARGKRPTLQRTQVNTVVQDALSRIPVPEGVAVVTELGRGLPPLMADPGQMEQVFINMISNAVQAMTSPGPSALRQSAGWDAPPSTGLGADRTGSSETSSEGRLEIVTKAENGFVVIEFKDSGCGISKENMERLFEPLFTTKATGVGLGLSVSKRIVEAHGGCIKVGSKVGKGATFRVKLPILVS